VIERAVVLSTHPVVDASDLVLSNVRLDAAPSAPAAPAASASATLGATGSQTELI